MKTVIPTEVYSRISGYFRPVMQWNKAKKEEFRERKFVDIKALQMPTTAMCSSGF